MFNCHNNINNNIKFTLEFGLSLGLSECAEAHTETVHIREVVNKKCCDNDCLGKLPLDLIRATREQSRELQVRCDIMWTICTLYFWVIWMLVCVTVM